MKQILVCVFGCLLSSAAFCGGLCVKSGIKAKVLNPNMVPISTTSNSMTWVVTFNNEVIKGTAGVCYNNNDGFCMGDVPGDVVPQNRVNNSSAGSRSSCVCKMTSPVESLWVTSATFAQSSGALGCVTTCKNVLNDASKRKKLLGGMFRNVVLP